ncbi:MAG: glycosyltransferase family 2 protein [Planctomycetota bacterium]|nr:glycosyltransferase family 2 protein [Planctomycetota bacterium]
MAEPERILLILPCYNEGTLIGDVLREVRDLDAGYDTLVIDDGSTDNSYEVASGLSPCVRLVENLGIGAAVHTGLLYARERGYDICVQVDGDGQHPPEEVRKLVAAYRSDPANLIIGSRYIDNDGFRSSFARRLGSRVIGKTLQLLFGKFVTDPTSGLRLFDRGAIAALADNFPHDYPEPIVVARALRQKLTLREVPVRMRERGSGESSIQGHNILNYMIRALGYIALARLGPRTARPQKEG